MVLASRLRKMEDTNKTPREYLDEARECLRTDSREYGIVENCAYLALETSKDPKERSEAYFYLGAINRITGKTDQAFDNYQKAITEDKTNAEAYFQIATILSQQGELQESKKMFETAFELNPSLRRRLKPAGLEEVTLNGEAISLAETIIKSRSEKSDIGIELPNKKNE